MDSGLVSLHTKMMLMDAMFAISRNWLILGGAVLAWICKTSRCQSIIKYFFKKRRTMINASLQLAPRKQIYFKFLLLF